MENFNKGTSSGFLKERKHGEFRGNLVKGSLSHQGNDDQDVVLV